MSNLHLWTGEPNPEWEAEQKALQATPEYQKRKSDIKRLVKILMEMIHEYKRIFADNNWTELESAGHRIRRVLTDHADRFRPEPWVNAPPPIYPPPYDPTFDYQRVDPYAKYKNETIALAFKDCHWQFKVGASLYLYQQMYDRHLVEEASLSKATWLLVSAPLPTDSSHEKRGRGDAGKIADQWKNYWDDAHRWAALAVLTRNPLEYDQNNLLNFLCSVDPIEFQMLSNAFLEFKLRVVIKRLNKRRLPYVKNASANDMYPAIPVLNPLDIPNLLTESQWSELGKYIARPKKQPK